MIKPLLKRMPKTLRKAAPAKPRILSLQAKLRPRRKSAPLPKRAVGILRLGPPAKHKPNLRRVKESAPRKVGAPPKPARIARLPLRAVKVPNRPTLAELASAAGMSRRLVAEVMSGRATGSVRVSEVSRRRVLETAGRVGYRTNRTARFIARGCHGSVAIVSTDLGHLPPKLADALARFAHEHDWLVVIERMPAACHQSRILGEDCVDGVFVFGVVPKDVPAWLTRHGIPAILVNTNTRFGPGCVTFDEEGAMRRVLATCAAARSRQPMFVPSAYPSARSHYSNRVRQEAFLAGCAAFGLDGRILHYPAADKPPLEAAADAMAARNPPGAIIVQEPLSALAVFRAAQAAGLRVPGDLLVFGVGHSFPSHPAFPDLILTQPDLERLAQVATGMMQRLLNNKPPGKARIPYVWNHYGLMVT